MIKKSDIRDALRNITDTQKKRTIIFSAKVIRVSGKVCDVEYNGMTITGVKLSPVTDSSNTSIAIKPKLQSYVTIIDASGGELRDLYAVLFTDITEVMFDAGENGGLIKVKELTEKINELVKAYNSFVEKFNTHIHTTTATIGLGPSVGVIAPVISKASKASELKKDYYENIKIKH